MTLRRDFLADGWNDKAIARAVREGALTRVRRGAYADAALCHSLDPVGRHALVARAVLRQAETDVLLSHSSALPEYDVPVWNIDLSTVHVTRRDRRSGRRERGVCQHAGLLLPEDIVERNGVPVTSPCRTVLDLTTVAGAEECLVVATHLVRAGETSVDELRGRYERGMEMWPRTLRTDLVLRLIDDRLESPGEVRAWYAMFRHGVPAPVPQYEIRDGGRVVARVDFAWPDLGVFLEFDGLVKYQGGADGQDPSGVVVREKLREDRIRELTGWRCIRITWADLQDPERLAARILRALYPAAA
ncbi:hypothetical protein FB382_000579 [Nocardioides ginsengisegetis]|uniref:Transcriptional regulator, AbiEi antitoxin, Type IV TA system n=1 Tax=Nocardioides ginsengisegetis TaxID=661491 RepID=A0A7W3P8C0_9ACTN|nr:type IV toxin-antitoxin system AbiEi family antitoxin domain-containing protein [Nocardioides ginsengisegetis]MBA8802288.1 hypothetical protein [Nocardioides ginsengisegetis]